MMILHIPVLNEQPATNAGLDATAKIKVNVTAKPFDGSVQAEGTTTTYVGEEPVNLIGNEDIKGYAVDSTDKKIQGSFFVSCCQNRFTICFFLCKRCNITACQFLTILINKYPMALILVKSIILYIILVTAFQGNCTKIKRISGRT